MPAAPQRPPGRVATWRPDRRAVAGTPRETRPRIGEELVEHGLADAEHVERAVAEQRRNGGRLGDILLARDLLDPEALQVALAEQAGLPSLVPEREAFPLLERADAHRLRAAALAGPAGSPRGAGPALIAVTDLQSVPELRALIGREVEPRLADERTMDALLAAAYVHADNWEATAALRHGRRRRRLVRVASAALALVALCGLVAGMAIAPAATLALLVGVCGLYWLVQARCAGRPPAHDEGTTTLAARVPLAELPRYSIVIPLRAERDLRLVRLHAELLGLDYPVHKLDGLALVDQADRTTRRALRKHPLPAWVRVVTVAAGATEGRDGLAVHGVRRARGRLVTVVGPGTRLAPTALLRVGTGQDQPVSGSPARLAARFTDVADPAWPSAVVHATGGRAASHFRAKDLHAAFGWAPADPRSRSAA